MRVRVWGELVGITLECIADHGEINALNSTRRMIGEMHSSKPPSFVMHIGDIAYVRQYQ